MERTARKIAELRILRDARSAVEAEALRHRGLEVATGTFGADMTVAMVNDGPVTLILDV